MTSFNKIIKDYCIQIPIIQRDYAQGRISEDINEIRRNFLETILYTLVNNKTLHLDFIYGSTNNETDKTVFIPLDGQQRLTTLFLLHWYFGKKEGKDISVLIKFTYETRSSSREFCNKLVNANIDFSSSNIVEQIKDSSWFMPFWEYDPTIKSMFIMIQDIHRMFNEYRLFDNLDLITFEFFELEKFGLDDDLYIKMNARGKPLTKFENFKATFEQLLNSINKKLETEFSRKIDKDWTNNFWEYKDGQFLIDTSFMNYFYYISEMLYIKEEKVEKELQLAELKKLIPIIYSNEDNIAYLFKSLDLMKKIQEVQKEVFSSNYEPTKVAIFDHNIDLLEKVIKNTKGNSINLQQKILLFLLINECMNSTISINNLKDKLRVARNLIERIRSLKQSQLTYTATLKYENLHQILNSFSLVEDNIYEYLQTNEFNLISTQITRLSLSDEINKARLISKHPEIKVDLEKLEDYKYIKGDLFNFTSMEINDFKYACHHIPLLFDKNDELIVRGMLTITDYKMWRGWAGENYKYFFGKKEYWEIVLTSNNRSISIITREFFQKFLFEYKNNNEDLNIMINNFIKNKSSKDWRYYFVKYNSFLSKETKLSNDRNLFAWYSDYSMEKMGGTNLNAYHINPFLKALAIKSDIYYNVFKWDGYSYLTIDRKIAKMYSKIDGWEIKFSEYLEENMRTSLIEEFKLEKKYSNNFVLKHDENIDTIEKASQLIKRLKI